MSEEVEEMGEELLAPGRRPVIVRVPTTSWSFGAMVSRDRNETELRVAVRVQTALVQATGAGR